MNASSFFTKSSNKVKLSEAETTEKVDSTPEADSSVVDGVRRGDASEDDVVEANATGSETNNSMAEDSEDDNECPVISECVLSTAAVALCVVLFV